MIWGDPHIVTFDLMRTVRQSFWNEVNQIEDGPGTWGLHQHVVPDFFHTGDYWVVKSARVNIQGRYGSDGGWALHGLAFSGPFLQEHTLVIEHLWEGLGNVTWDGRHVSALPSFRNRLVQVGLTLDRRGQLKHANVSLPEGVKVKVERNSWNRGRSASVTACITMHKQTGGQDGHCGRADRDLSDDTTEHLFERWGSQVPAGELLFSRKTTNLLASGMDPELGDKYNPAKVCATEPPPLKDVKLCEARLNGSATALAGVLRHGCLVDVCVGGPEAIEAVVGAAQQATEQLLLAGPPPSVPDGWYDAGPQKTCDEGCQALGLVCTEAQLHAHNADVDSSKEVHALIRKLGGNTSKRACEPAFNLEDDVPNWFLEKCYYSRKKRALSTFDCAARPRGTRLPKHRLCYCHAAS